MQGPEVPGSHETISQPDLEYASRVLSPSALPQELPEAGIFDERWAVVQDALDAREAMRGSLRTAAAAAGLEVGEDDVRDWQPDDRELAALRGQLTIQRQRLNMIDGLGLFINDQSLLAEMEGVPLRPYQREPVEASHEFIVHAPRNEYGGKSGIIEMPTGGGKTAIFSSMVAQLKYGETAEEPIRVLVLVPTQDILEQTLGIKGDRGFGKFAPHLEVGAYYQYSKQLDKEVTVMTTVAFNQLMAEGAMPYFPAVIVDEPHTFLGEVTADNIERYIQDKVAIALDATPEYDEDHSAYQIFEHRIYQANFKDMVKAGRLAPVRGFHLSAEPEIDPRDLPDDPAERRRYIRAARLEARMQVAEKIIKASASQGRGVLVRTPAGDDIEVAVYFAKRLRDLGFYDIAEGGYHWIRAWPVGGSTARQTKDQRNLLYSAFDRGEVDVLTYVKAIGIGWDSLHAKDYIDLVGTTSRVEAYQNGGRVMRLVIGADGLPVEAAMYTFVNPEQGDRQYTCLDVLESKHGELISHETTGEAPIPVARRFRRRHSPEVVSVTETVVGEMAVAHEAGVELPSNVEIRAFVRTLRSDTISFEDTCDALCLDAALLRRIMKSNHINHKRPIPVGELTAILDQAPIIIPDPVPEQGYTSSADIAVLADVPVRMLSVRSYALRRGIEPLRFQEPDGSIGLYYRDEDVETLLGWINDGTYKQEFSKE